MRIRSFLQHDLARLTELTIETFGPFYEGSFRPLVGEVVQAARLAVALAGGVDEAQVARRAGLEEPSLERTAQ